MNQLSTSTFMPAFFPIFIPTNQAFLKKWYVWTAGKVARHFKRDKERCQDTAQNVRVRLLSKNFIGRWFFKHLTDEFVDKEQAEFILGGISLSFNGSIKPIYGHRSVLRGYGEDQRVVCDNCKDTSRCRKCVDPN